jgi:FG-GAP-like repeat
MMHASISNRRTTQSVNSLRAGSVVTFLSIFSSSVMAQSFSGFAALEHVRDVGSARGIAAGDFDHDGDLDFAVSADVAGPTGLMNILTNNGSGVLVISSQFQVGSLPQNPEVGDFNNDGNLDIAVPSIETDSISVALGNGDGTFQTAINYATINAPNEIVLANFDGDAFLDIGVTSWRDDRVATLEGTGAGFSVGALIGTNFGVWGDGPGSIQAADLNGDGSQDLIVGSLFSDDISIYYGFGNGGFFTGEFGLYIDMPDGVFALDTSDHDQDGDLDIVAAYTSKDASVAWLRSGLSSGETFPDFNDGFFSTHVGGRITELDVVDLDCGDDNFPDMLAVNELTGSEELQVFLNPSGGSFAQQPTPVLPGGSPTGVVGVDVDNDGDVDAVVCDLSGNARVYLNLCQGNNCPADLSGDGDLNFFDVSAFLAAYAANDPVADLAAPVGSWNFFDVSAFLQLYMAGCP